MQSWEHRTFKSAKETMIHIWRGDDLEERNLPAGKSFNPADEYCRDNEISYIEVCRHTECLAFYRKAECPKKEVRLEQNHLPNVQTENREISGKISNISV